MPAVTPWGRRKQAAEAWFEVQAEAGNHRQTIDHLKLALKNQRDPRDIKRTELYIAQHEEQLAALRREADLRANESPKQTKQRHDAERKAAEAAERYRRDNPPPPSPEELARRRQDEIIRRQQMEKADQLERLTYDVRVLAEAKASEVWAKAQQDHPTDHGEAQKAARQAIRREINVAVGSRVWPQSVQDVFEHITHETFTVPQAEPKLDPTPAPEPEPVENQPPSPRTSGPSLG